MVDEMIENDELDEAQSEVVMQHYDKAMCNALAHTVKSRAVIKASLHHYRYHDDIWTFFLDNIEVKVDNVLTLSSSERTSIVSVGKR